jgi:CRP-like cAMP-binding protein
MKHESFAADAKLVQALGKVSQPISCSEGRTLFTQGQASNGLYILERGEAALVLKSNSGRTVMCLNIGEGALIGLPAVVADEP